MQQRVFIIEQYFKNNFKKFESCVNFVTRFIIDIRKKRRVTKRWPLERERERGGYAAVGIEFRHGPTPKGERVGLYSLVSRRVITPLSDIPPSVSDLHAFPLDRRLSPPLLLSPFPQRCLVGKQTRRRRDHQPTAKAITN